MSPRERLHPQDFYHQLDWILREWRGDEYVMAKKLVKLRRLLEHLPTAYYVRTLRPLSVLARARLINGEPWKDALLDLRGLVSEWDRSRPSPLRCEVCGTDVRGRPQLNQHLEIVHGVTVQDAAIA